MNKSRQRVTISSFRRHTNEIYHNIPNECTHAEHSLALSLRKPIRLHHSNCRKSCVGHSPLPAARHAFSRKIRIVCQMKKKTLSTSNIIIIIILHSFATQYSPIWAAVTVPNKLSNCAARISCIDAFAHSGVNAKRLWAHKMHRPHRTHRNCHVFPVSVCILCHSNDKPIKCVERNHRRFPHEHYDIEIYVYYTSLYTHTELVVRRYIYLWWVVA